MPRKKKGSTTGDGLQKHDARKQGYKAIVVPKAEKYTAAGMTKAKKARIKLHATNAIIDTYGSEEQFWLDVAGEAKNGSFKHLEMLTKYAFPDPKQIHDVPISPGKTTNIVQFVGSNEEANRRVQDMMKQTIDVTPKQDAEDEAED